MTTPSTSATTSSTFPTSSADAAAVVHLAERRLGAAHVLWTDRRGGVSEGRYASLNLGDHVGDLPAAVAENRRRVACAVASRIAGLEVAGPSGERGAPAPIVWLHQVHGSRVHAVASSSGAGGDGPAPVADAAVTDLPGVGVAVLSADCVPVALSCEGAAGVAHAGWKGLTGGAVEEAVAEMRRIGGRRVRALIGPCVHPRRYAFGAADLERVADRLGARVVGRTDQGGAALDLPAAARVVLSPRRRRGGRCRRCRDLHRRVDGVLLSPARRGDRKAGDDRRAATVIPGGGPAEAAERLAEVRERIAAAAARAGRSPSEVALVAVSKTVEVPRIREVIAAGQRDLGENRAQELLGKAAEIAASATDPDPTWHFVGRLQRNKVKALAPRVACWHSIDRPELVVLLARHAPGACVYVEVNLGDEPQKGGCTPEAAAGLVEELTGAGIVVEGLMTVPPAGGEPRRYFGRLRDLAEGLGLRGLSMGMSGDFETAVEEGATVVRVGSAIFGPRRTAADLRR